MDPQTRAVKFTYEDYQLFPDDGRRHELIHGEHFVTPAPNTKHQAVSSNLHYLLTGFVRENKLGHVFAAPLDVVLSDIDVVQSDLVFIAAAHASILTEPNIQGAPDLVIEIVSESSRKSDEVIKRKLYERFGVREYWVVDPLLETVKVYRPAAGAADEFERAGEYSAESDDRLETPLLAGLILPLRAIFA